MATQRSTPIDRLLPEKDFLKGIGVKSPNTLKEMIKRGEVPPPIKRGRYNFYLESELSRYVEKFVAQRVAA